MMMKIRRSKRWVGPIVEKDGDRDENMKMEIARKRGRGWG